MGPRRRRAGGGGENCLLLAGDETRERVPDTSTMQVQAGDVLRKLISGGGGGGLAAAITTSALAWESTGSILPMEATVDDVGRIVLPKQLRDRLRLTPGTKVDVSEYGDGLHVTPVSRTARLEERDGRLVAVAETPVTDDDVLALVDAGRR